ncbi:MAG: Xaa-Pro peptidase family protein [Candidatus Cloacimonetes bacterium]|nr:Xaa-Pro peptidase family protein [Candidatus Cloacimonadota bacterium]
MEKFIIPDSEFSERFRRIQSEMKENGVDVLLVFGNEAEPQFLRYLSDYWPSFETGGVLLGQDGDPILLIGPESLTYAKDHSRISRILRIQSFRESSNPEYPDLKIESFDDALDLVSSKQKLSKCAIAGFNIISQLVYIDFLKSVQRRGGFVVNGDLLIMKFRMIKSENELQIMKKASCISNAAMKFTIDNIKLGMSEFQAKGLGIQKMFELGAESEAYPTWVLVGKGGNQAIARPRRCVIHDNDLVHINLGARVEGYASSIGRQVIFGKVDDWVLSAIEKAYEAHDLVLKQLYDGNNAKKVASTYYNCMKDYKEWLLYGPCHASGLMEGEPPWIESNSDYLLHENMTYCIDIFMRKPGTEYGFRVEDSVRVGKTCGENMTNFPKEIFRK